MCAFVTLALWGHKALWGRRNVLVPASFSAQWEILSQNIRKKVIEKGTWPLNIQHLHIHIHRIHICTGTQRPYSLKIQN